jgi:uncharacterized membrane protein HdeD (DUF308 family)
MCALLIQKREYSSMKIWSLLLGAWLILHGLAVLLDLSFRYDDLVKGALALVAGIFVLIRK